MNNKVFGTIEVDILADYLTSNKEDFKKITKVNEVLKKAKQGFYDFLKKQDLISGDIHDTRRKQAIDSKLTERLNEILKNKEYKFLGPLMRTAQQRNPNAEHRRRYRCRFGSRCRQTVVSNYGASPHRRDRQ